MPALSDVVGKVQKEVDSMLAAIEAGRLDEGNFDRLQRAIVAGTQALIPPMRGKPFYTLELIDNGENSMPTPKQK